MGVTTVDIDKELLREAKEVLGAGTTKATIDLALREVVMRHRQAAALDGLADITFDVAPTKIEYDPAAVR